MHTYIHWVSKEWGNKVENMPYFRICKLGLQELQRMTPFL